MNSTPRNARLAIALFAGNFPASACHSVTAHYRRVYPPNELTPLYVGYM
jgi:hypothetical protein